MHKIIIKSLIVFLSTLVAVVYTSSADAQVAVVLKENRPLDLSGAIEFSDNFNPTLNQELDATGAAVSAKGAISEQAEGFAWQVNYMAELSRFNVSDAPTVFEDEQSFITYQADGLLRLYLTNSFTLDAELSRQRTDERFGTGLSLLRRNVIESDTRNETSGSLNFIYGSDLQDRYIALKLRARDIDYNDANPYGQFFDSLQLGIQLNASMRVSDGTRWLARLEATEDDYDSEQRIDSELYRALVGLNWQPSGKSNLSFLVGAYRRDYDDGDNDTGLSWDIGYTYQPVNYFQLQFSSYRLSVQGESELATDSVDSNYAARLRYSPSQRWYTEAFFDISNSVFNEQDGESELDESTYGVDLTWQFNLYHRLKMILENVDTEFLDNQLNYRQNQIRFIWQYDF